MKCLMRRFSLRWFLMVLMAAAVFSAAAPAWGARRGCPGPFPFRNDNDSLRRALEGRIRKAGYGKLLDKKLLTLSLVDLTRADRVYYAGLNDDVMLYAASLPKIAILLSVVEAVKAKRLTWTHTFDRRLMDMIVASDNQDASWATDLVGLLAIERVMRSPRYCLYSPPHGGLWVGRAYRSGGASNRDPLFNISHGATARQAARFYMLMDAGQLVTPHWSFRMRTLMAPPKHRHKFVGGLSGRPGVVFLARKSGTWRTYHSDSALIQHGNRRYIAVALANWRHGEKLMQHLAAIMDDIIVAGQHRRRSRSRPAARR